MAIFNDAANPPQDAIFIDRGGQLSFAGQPLQPADFAAVVAGGAPKVIVVDRRLQAQLLVKLLSGLAAKGLAVPPLITLRPPP